MTPAPAPPIAVAAGVIVQDGRVLIAQRAATAHLGGLWEFPGGKRRAGETPEDCVAREIAEELGVTVRVGPRIAERVHAYPDRTVHLCFYVCEITSGLPVARGCAAFAWVAPAELKRYPFPEANAWLVDGLAAGALARLTGPVRESGRAD